MKRLVFVFMALIFTGLTFAQAPNAKKNITLTLKYDPKGLHGVRRMALSDFRNKMHKWAMRNYSLGYPGLVELWFSVESDNVKTIEGMETVTLADVTLNIKLVNSITDEEKVWEKTVKSRGTSIADLERSTVLKLPSNIKNEISQFFDDYLVGEFINNCQKYYAIAEKKYDEGKYVEAIRILSYIREGTTCEDKAKSLMEEAFLLEQKKVCNDYMYNAKLAYESGDYERSLSQLYQISPRSLCAKEAMKLAKKIGKKFKHSNDVSTKSINIHKFIIEHADLEKQAEWDEKIMMDLIRHN